jgi:hypothetical protein
MILHPAQFRWGFDVYLTILRDLCILKDILISNIEVL